VQYNIFIAKFQYFSKFKLFLPDTGYWQRAEGRGQGAKGRQLKIKN
jgi:hypothetical protein